MLGQQKNTKKQGDVGLGAAIAYFTLQGYCVSVPLTDSQDYDLIVDDGAPKRVQVKTSTHQAPSKAYVIQICVKGGNLSGKDKVKPFDSTKVDLIFALTPDGSYVIPSDAFQATNCLTLGSKYTVYKTV